MLENIYSCIYTTLFKTNPYQSSPALQHLLYLCAGKVQLVMYSIIPLFSCKRGLENRKETGKWGKRGREHLRMFAQTDQAKPITCYERSAPFFHPDLILFRGIIMNCLPSTQPRRMPTACYKWSHGLIELSGISQTFDLGIDTSLHPYKACIFLWALFLFSPVSYFHLVWKKWKDRKVIVTLVHCYYQDHHHHVPQYGYLRSCLLKFSLNLHGQVSLSNHHLSISFSLFWVSCVLLPWSLIWCHPG